MTKTIIIASGEDIPAILLEETNLKDVVIVSNNVNRTDITPFVAPKLISFPIIPDKDGKQKRRERRKLERKLKSKN